MPAPPGMPLYAVSANQAVAAGEEVLNLVRVGCILEHLADIHFILADALVRKIRAAGR